MKSILSYSLLAAAMAAGVAYGQATTATTTPVGYITQALTPNQFNMVGLGLQGSVAATGKVTAVSGAEVTDVNANFGSFVAGATYILEVTASSAPAATGVVQEFVSWTANQVTLPAAIAGLAVGDSYLIRKAPTLEDVFGTTTSVLQKGLNAGAADIVWVPNGGGDYDQYFLNTGSTFRKITGTTSVAAPQIPLIYLDGVWVQKRGTASTLVISGEVKKASTTLPIINGFSLVGNPYPVGVTLQNLGLEASIGKGLNSGAADIVWVPSQPAGSYTKYWLSTANVWRIDDENPAVTDPVAPADVPVGSAVLIQRRGVGKAFTLTPPANYSSL
jgi:hypothetical protein